MRYRLGINALVALVVLVFVALFLALGARAGWAQDYPAPSITTTTSPATPPPVRPPTPEALPRTGTDLDAPLLVAGAFVLVGVAGLAIGARRRSHSAHDR